MLKSNSSKSKSSRGIPEKRNWGSSNGSTRAGGWNRTPSTKSANGPKSGKNTSRTTDFWDLHPEAAKRFDRAIQLKCEEKIPEAVEIVKGLVDEFPKESALSWFLGSLQYHQLDAPVIALSSFRK